MALACTYSNFASLDKNDIEAVQSMLDACMAVVLDPVLWSWVIGFTVVSVAVGALIGWMKGRTLLGLIWGAALGPIGWIVIAFYPVAEIGCPRCGKPNSTHAKRCRHCMTDFTRLAKRSARSEHKDNDSGGGW